MWYTIILIVLLLVIWFPFRMEQMRPSISAAQRAEATGDFAELSQGVTHYHWVGPFRGPVAIVIHGLTTPSVGVNDVAAGLGGLGYRVLVYDLYGRGLSDAVRGRQNQEFFLQQLSDLLAHENLRDELTLVGYSMGGAIATAFAGENPHRVKRLILLASAGVLTKESYFSRFCRKVPLLGDWAHALLGRLQIRSGIPRPSKRNTASHVHRAQRLELKRRGYLPAVLSSRRGILADSQEDIHRKLRLEDVPVAAVWAEKDKVIPIEAADILADWNRGVQQKIIANTDHAMPYTDSDAVIEAIKEVQRD